MTAISEPDRTFCNSEICSCVSQWNSSEANKWTAHVIIMASMIKIPAIINIEAATRKTFLRTSFLECSDFKALALSLPSSIASDSANANSFSTLAADGGVIRFTYPLPFSLFTGG